MIASKQKKGLDDVRRLAKKGWVADRVFHLTGVDTKCFNEPWNFRNRGRRLVVLFKFGSEHEVKLIQNPRL